MQVTRPLSELMITPLHSCWKWHMYKISLWVDRHNRKCDKHLLMELKNLIEISSVGWATGQSILFLAGVILCMCPANKSRRYNVASYFIGWAHTQNDPCPGLSQLLRGFPCATEPWPFWYVRNKPNQQPTMTWLSLVQQSCGQLFVA